MALTATASGGRMSLDEPWRALMIIRQDAWIQDEDSSLNRTDSDSSLDGYGSFPDMMGDKLISSRIETHAPAPKGAASQCVICMQRPSTIAFLHGTSLHTCCCEQCARQYAKTCQDEDGMKCPYCRQPSEGVYTNYTV